MEAFTGIRNPLESNPTVDKTLYGIITKTKGPTLTFLIDYFYVNDLSPTLEEVENLVRNSINYLLESKKVKEIDGRYFEYNKALQMENRRQNPN